MTTGLTESTRRLSGRFVHTGLEYERRIPPSPAARLREVSPPSTEHGYLVSVWEPGDNWLPVERWMLYEVVDPRSPALFDAASSDLLRELQGPHPRTYGHICTSVPTHEWRGRAPAGYQPCLCRHKTESWRRGPCQQATMTQWNLFHRTGLVGFPFWVIQGRHGGHKFHFTKQESLLMDNLGLPMQPPVPGALPYAEFGENVARKIMQYNRLMRYRNNLRVYRDAMGRDGYMKVMEEEDKALRIELVAHLTDQLQDANEFFVRGVKHGEHLNLPLSNVNYDRLAEESEASYIETGEIMPATAGA